MRNSKLILTIAATLVATQAIAAEPKYRGSVVSPYATPHVQNGPEARNSAISGELPSITAGPEVRNSQVNALDDLAPTSAGPITRNGPAKTQEPEHVALTNQKTEQAN